MAEQLAPARMLPARDIGALRLLAVGPTVISLLNVINAIAAIQYLQCFDAAQVSDVTLGTTNPDLEIQVPVSGAAPITMGSNGVRFLKGLVVASTTGEKGATPSGAGVQLFIGAFGGV